MNTLSDIAPSRLEKTDFKTRQNSPAEHVGQIYKRILVGTDFSPASTAAFEQGLELARQNGAELLIAHAAVAPNSLGFMPPESYGEWETHYRTEMEKSMGGLMEKARQQGVKAHRLVLEGLADDAIIDAAGRLGIDLIVVGTHGRRGVSRFFMGSTAAHVVARAPCAVLTARSCHRAERR